MALNDLLGRLLLGATLAAGSMYGCGGAGSSGMPCQSDTECKEERMCVEGRCASPTDSGDDRCGNSPLNGKYLWDVGNCETGAVTGGNPQSCTFEMQGDFNGTVHYEGNKITIGEHGTYELKNRFSEDELIKGEFPEEGVNTLIERCLKYNNRQELIEAYQCALSLDSGLLISKGTMGICLIDNLSKIRDDPWPGSQDACQAEEYQKPWYTDCFGNGINP